MGLYSGNEDESINIETALENPNLLREAFIYDELSRLPDDERNEFIQSEEAQVMVEKGLIGRKTLVRLSKKDDIERRTGMASIMIGKEKNDPLYTQLIKNRIKEKELLSKLDSKYAAQAIALAKRGQREFLHKRIPKRYAK